MFLIFRTISVLEYLGRVCNDDDTRTTRTTRYIIWCKSWIYRFWSIGASSTSTTTTNVHCSMTALISRRICTISRSASTTTMSSNTTIIRTSIRSSSTTSTTTSVSCRSTTDRKINTSTTRTTIYS